MTRTVLIVDDEYGLAEMVSYLFAMRGYESHLAANGVAGLELARLHRFDLVLTDVMMPLMDGIEMIRHIRALPERAAAAIIVMTAMPNGLGPDERALAQGVLTKPFGYQELFHLVDAVVPPPGG